MSQFEFLFVDSANPPQQRQVGLLGKGQGRQEEARGQPGAHGNRHNQASNGCYMEKENAQPVQRDIGP